MRTIEAELLEEKARLEGQGKLLEAQRLFQRTMFDLEMLRETGLLPRHRELLAPPLRAAARRAAADAARLPAEGRADGHRRVAPVGAAGARDVRTATGSGRRRSSSTASACPRRSTTGRSTSTSSRRASGQVVYVSATPGPYELQKAGGVVVEQVIRPTGLMDPQVEVRPVEGPGRRPAGRDPRCARRAASACSSRR